MTRRPSELLPIGTKTENDRRFGGIGVVADGAGELQRPGADGQPVDERGPRTTVTRFEALAKP